MECAIEKKNWEKLLLVPFLACVGSLVDRNNANGTLHPGTKMGLFGTLLKAQEHSFCLQHLYPDKTSVSQLSEEPSQRFKCQVEPFQPVKSHLEGKTVPFQVLMKGRRIPPAYLVSSQAWGVALGDFNPKRTIANRWKLIHTQACMC